MGLEHLDRWLLQQQKELLEALVKAAAGSSDPEVRGIVGRLLAVQGTLAASQEAKKAGDIE